MADEGSSRQDIWASEASLSLLGPVRLTGRNGEELTPKARKTRALLAIVALSRSSVTRSRLTDLLWGDRGEDQAKASLRQALYELRDLTNAGLITATREAVAIGPKRLWTDLGQVEPATTDPRDTAEALQGLEWPPLADLDDITPELDDWLRDERARVQATLTQRSSDAAESALASGDAAAARMIADALQRIDPVDERAARIGVKADLALGDRPAAHRRISRLEEKMRDELELEPSPETRALLKDAPLEQRRAIPEASPAPSAAARTHRRWLVAILGVVLLLLAAGAFYLFRPRAAEANPTVAVLPFEESGQNTRGYFAAGVSDEILNMLAKDRKVRVLGRVTTEQIADQPDALEIARSLNITHLLDGNVRTAGDRVLVIVTLTRVSEGAQLWSERYERRLGDIFAVQGDIARTVATRLARSFEARAAQVTTPEVYDRYLAARQLVRDRREVTLNEADRLLREAIQLDPDYAPAYAELAQVLMLRSDHPTSYGSLPFDQARAEAMRMAKRAIQLDPNLGDAYAAMGFVNLQDKTSAPFYRKAVELSPQRPEYHRWLATSLSEQDRFDEGIEEYRRTVQIDPLWYINYEHLAGALAYVGRYDEARQVASQFLKLSSDDRAKLLLLRALAEDENRLADALRYTRAVYQRSPDERLSRFYYASVAAQIGELPQARSLMASDPMVSALLRSDWPGFARQAEGFGHSFWERSDLWEAAIILVATGQSDVLLRLYDEARPLIEAQSIDVERVAQPPAILALARAGRTEEANRLLRIFAARSRKLPSAGIGGQRRQINEAYIAAFTGRKDEALQRLDALSRQYPMALSTIPIMSVRNNPFLRSLRSDPRLIVVDERLRAAINTERRKAGLPLIDQAAWISDPKMLLTKN